MFSGITAGVTAFGGVIDLVGGLFGGGEKKPPKSSQRGNTEYYLKKGYNYTDSIGMAIGALYLGDESYLFSLKSKKGYWIYVIVACLLLIVGILRIKRR